MECIGFKQTGEKCTFNAPKGSKYCRFHDPAPPGTPKGAKVVKLRREMPSNPESGSPKSIGGLVDYLGDLMTGLLQGDIRGNVGEAAVKAVNTQYKILSETEEPEDESEVDELQEALRGLASKTAAQ